MRPVGTVGQKMGRGMGVEEGGGIGLKGKDMLEGQNCRRGGAKRCGSGR